jgi:glutamate carboxypeptidase
MVAEYAEEIERYCRAHYEEMVSLLERIVNVDSASDNPAGVDELARVLQAELGMAGCETERVPPDASLVEPWVATFFLPDLGGYDRVAPHLVGRWSGRGTGHALLVGHMDTAFAPGEAQRTPFRRDGDRATGCAIADMKGGLVVLLYALKALVATGVPAPRITLIYDSDEQVGSLTARAVIEGVIRKENVSWMFKAETSRGGAFNHKRPAIGIALVEVEGQEALAGWGGSSAIMALAHKAIALERLTGQRPGWVVNVGQIEGGRRRNLVPGHAGAKLGLRAWTQGDWDALVERVQAIVAEETLPGTSATVRIFEHRPSMEPTERTQQLIGVVQDAARSLDMTAEFRERSAASDANFGAALGVPTLDGFGPTGDKLMTRDEVVDLPTLVTHSALLATTLCRLAGDR